MIKGKQQNKIFTMKIFRCFYFIVSLIYFISCVESREKEIAIYEEPSFGVRFVDKIIETINHGDSVLALNKVFSGAECDVIYIFPAYTSTNLIYAVTANKFTLPFKEEVPGNQEFLVCGHEGIVNSYFFLGEKVVIADLKEYKFAVDSSSVLLRKFSRMEGDVIYLLNYNNLNKR